MVLLWGGGWIKFNPNNESGLWVTGASEDGGQGVPDRFGARATIGANVSGTSEQ